MNVEKYYPTQVQICESDFVYFYLDTMQSKNMLNYLQGLDDNGYLSQFKQVIVEIPSHHKVESWERILVHSGGIEQQVRLSHFKAWCLQQNKQFYQFFPDATYKNFKCGSCKAKVQGMLGCLLHGNNSHLDIFLSNKELKFFPVK